MTDNTKQGQIYYTKNRLKLPAKRIVQKGKEKLLQIQRRLSKIKITKWKNYCKMKEIAARIRQKKQKVVYKGPKETLKDLKKRRKIRLETVSSLNQVSLNSNMISVFLVNNCNHQNLKLLSLEAIKKDTHSH